MTARDAYSERVCITRSQLEDLDHLCHGEVTRDGHLEACMKDATAVLYDAESASIWPACTWHANRWGGALTLAEIATAHREGSVWFEREVACA